MIERLLTDKRIEAVAADVRITSHTWNPGWNRWRRRQ
jgi:hypothetical protein